MTEAADPVCGMTVLVSATTEMTRHDEFAYYFCCGGCRTRFEGDPLQYAAARGRQR